jgi:hypothetical protein
MVRPLFPYPGAGVCRDSLSAEYRRGRYDGGAPADSGRERPNYESPAIGASFPCLQILTIEGLLSGTEQPRYPNLAQGGHTFKKAKVEKKQTEQGDLF